MDPNLEKMHTELLYMIMQFLREEQQVTVQRKLEENSVIYLNQEYLGKLITEGDWDDAATYISAFTNSEDNKNSDDIFFLLHKQKFLEALHKGEHAKASYMLEHELNAFSPQHQKACTDLRKMLRTKHFRDHESFSGFEDLKSTRENVLHELKDLITTNPKLCTKLEFPNMENSRLKKVIYHGERWQLSLCRNPSEILNIGSLFLEHSSDEQRAVEVPSPNADGSFEINACNIPTQSPSVPAGIYDNSIVTTPISPGDKNIPISRRSLKRRLHEETDNRQHDDLPLSVITSCSSDAKVTCMEFHPLQQGLLLIGLKAGGLLLWDVSSEKILVHRTFKNWKEKSNGPKTSIQSSAVKAVRWNTDGEHLALAYSSNLVRLFGYRGGIELNGYQEMEAHKGSVNDTAFITTRDGNLYVITCGDDKFIKVYDAIHGENIFSFKGHRAPIISVCPRNQDLLGTFVSTDLDGKVKIWHFNAITKTSKKETLLTTPHQIAAKVSLSTDETRLFLGGTSRNNVSCIVEVDQVDGSIIHTYHGLVETSFRILQYDIANGRYLAAVDENLLKFWDVNSEEVLKITAAGGGLVASTCIKFNKEGTLLAVTTSDNEIKILTNEAGRRLLRATGKRTVKSRTAAPSVAMIPNTRTFKAIVPCRTNPQSRTNMDDIDASNMLDKNNRKDEGLVKLTETCNLKEIKDASQCLCRRLTNKFKEKSVCCLAYTRGGRALLALGSDGEHRFWQWKKESGNTNGMATTRIAAKVFLAPEYEIMFNDVEGTNPEDNASCFALPKNSSSFLVSTSGGMVSIFNTVNFARIENFMSSPRPVTFLAIHPTESNKFILGMCDGTIQIYDYKTQQVLSTFCGHTKRVTGLTFSTVFNVLVSSGADSQVCTWRINEWEKLKSVEIQNTRRRASDTRVEFHMDQTHFLAVDKTQIAIYRVPDLNRVHRWTPKDDSSSFITHAAYSCDCLSIYVSFGDGSVGVIDASSLVLRCKIYPAAYLPHSIRPKTYPLVVAANPSDPNQFALGLNNGVVVVLEPFGDERAWGSLPGNKDADNNVIVIEEEVEEGIDLDQLLWEDRD